MPAGLARNLNSVGLLVISLILALAFYYQFVLRELPCPLCILQRAGFAVAGFGVAMNVLFRPRPQHYALTLLGAVAGAAVAVRQILLHIVPGTGAYGSPLLGIHFDTWAFIGFTAIIVGTAAMLLWSNKGAAPGRPPMLGLVAVGCFAALVLLNGLSTVAECSLGLCPENPVAYELLDPPP